MEVEEDNKNTYSTKFEKYRRHMERKDSNVNSEDSQSDFKDNFLSSNCENMKHGIGEPPVSNHSHLRVKQNTFYHSPPKKIFISRATEIIQEAPLNLTIVRDSTQSSPIPTYVDENALLKTPNGYINQSQTPVTSQYLMLEEHFQRSLGSQYSMLKNSSHSEHRPVPKSPACQKIESSKEVPAVSVSGIVDDHFRKSLGDVWHKVKATHLGVELDIMPTSVDDHFAKALGETWNQIQADSGSSISASLNTNSPKNKYFPPPLVLNSRT